jgi:MFS family permease
MLPYLLFGLVIGAWTDRVNRKRLMILTDLMRAAVIAFIPLLGVLNLLSVEWIYAVIFASSTLSIFFDSAGFAAIPSLASADDLVTANGRIQASYSGAAVIGPLLAGLVIAVAPIQTVLLIDALSFAISALSLALIWTNFNAGGTRRQTNIGQDIVEGLDYVFHHPVLRNISVMMALVNFVSTSAHAQIVLLAKQHFLATDSEVGFLYSAAAVGVIVLSLLAGPLRKYLCFSKVALGSLMLHGLLIALLAVTPSYWAAVVIWALTSGFGVLFNINTGSLRQALVILQPETLRRWHRQGFKLFWRVKIRGRRGRPPLAPDLVVLIQRITAENPRWGAERIRGELLKLGIRVAKDTLQTYILRVHPPKPAAQTWEIFLKNHAKEIWACGFLPVIDLWFRPLRLFFVVELASGRVVRLGVTRLPTDAWVAQ